MVVKAHSHHPYANGTQLFFSFYALIIILASLNSKVMYSKSLRG